MQIKITVVIPTFRRPKLLIRCLRALNKQTVGKSDFEVIVVSDGPDNDTLVALLPWLKKKALKLTYLHTATKQGPAAARNLGWLSARAQLIAFTDDDCLPDKHWLELFLANYEEGALMAFSGKTIVPLTESPTDFAINTAHLQDAEFITANCACTKPALIKAGGFDERFRLAWREDSDLQFKFLSQNIPIKKVAAAVVTHPVRQAPWGVSIKEQKKGVYDALLFRKFPDLYRAKIEQNPLWNYYLINLIWLILLISVVVHAGYLLIFSIIALILLISAFTYKRLKKSSKSLDHVLEMFTTSIIIPTLSVYWRIYGAIKYRVFFI